MNYVCGTNKVDDEAVHINVKNIIGGVSQQGLVSSLIILDSWVQ